MRSLKKKDNTKSTPLQLQKKSTISRCVQLVSLVSVFLVGLTIIRVNNDRQVFSDILLYTYDSPVQTATTSLLANSEETFQTENYTLIEIWRKKRVGKDIYDSWFANKDGKGALAENADSEGPILDFLIAGFPKCGTTAMMNLLATITTMPSNQDVCTPIANTVYYSYINWSIQYGNGANNYTDEKPLRGNKCPRYLEGSDLDAVGKMLPKTNFIVGIRHPVLWFQSFTNMQWHNGKAERIKDGSNETLAEYVSAKHIGFMQVNHKCPRKHGRKTMVECVARSRFHLSLARLGKTPLDQNEIDLLQSEIRQSTLRLNDTTNPRNFPFSGNNENVGVPNKIFLYESSQGKEEYFYQDLAKFLEINRARLPALDNKVYRSGNGLNNLEKSKNAAKDKKSSLDICLPEFDTIRKELLPISYTLGQWLKQYLIPASHQRDDLTIPNVTAFESIIEHFARDPCHRLVRNDDDGEYYLAEKENATSN